MSPTTRPSARALAAEQSAAAAAAAATTASGTASTATGAKRAPGSLKLAGLPRFHPANFPGPSPAGSSASSTTSPISINFNVSSAPSSPRSQYRSYGQHQRLSDVQRHIFAHQHDPSGRSRLASPYSPIRSPPPNGVLRSPRPKSPHLVPLGSPGPVTPLELEEADGYFAPPSSTTLQLSEADKKILIESYVRKDAHAGRFSPSPDPEQGSRPASRRGESMMHRSNLSR